MPGDFNYGILRDVDHRPWPMPRSPWLMTQTWRRLLFLHWPCEPSVLRERLPAEFELDLFDGHAWIGVVPFEITNMAPRGLATLPFLSAFPELNVRTYVMVNGRPGVYFFSLDAASALAVVGARTFFHLPYFRAQMSAGRDGDWIVYASRRRSSGAAFAAKYRPRDAPSPPRRGTLEYFLTERYCLYTLRGGAAATVEIHHPPWPLQPAQAVIGANTMTTALGIALPDTPPLAHYAERQDVVNWALTPVTPRSSRSSR